MFRQPGNSFRICYATVLALIWLSVLGGCGQVDRASRPSPRPAGNRLVLGSSPRPCDVTYEYTDPDGTERSVTLLDTDCDGYPDINDRDADGDGNEENPDSDGDGLADAADEDDDNDGISDFCDAS